MRGTRRENHHKWIGGRRKNDQGYVMLRDPNHPRANKTGYVREHIVVMERVLGRPLASGEVVHHINRQRDDNRPENLQLFASNSAHTLHHCDEDAFTACGNKDWRKCWMCRTYGDPSTMFAKGKGAFVHKACSNNACKERRDRKLSGRGYPVRPYHKKPSVTLAKELPVLVVPMVHTLTEAAPF